MQANSRSFKIGYDNGYADAEVKKASCCVANEEAVAELTRKLEVAKNIAKEAIQRIDCLPTCRSNSDSWLIKCSCGADKKEKELRKALKELE